MKMYWRAALVGLALLTQRTGADSIDDAEAKRRGVPVAQVQAENALAAEKRKEADLEKQVAEARKKVAELSTQPATDKGTSAASAVGRGSTGAASQPADAPLYVDLVNRYLAGDWGTLASDMAAKEKEIAALPAANVTDLTYIKQVVAECRPAWWEGVKGGKVKQFRQEIWKQSVEVRFQSAAAPRLADATAGNGAMTVSLSWPAADMDSDAPLMLSDMGLANLVNFGFRKADDVGSTAWGMLGQAALISQAGPDKVAHLAAAERKQFDEFADFRRNLSAAYFGTPPMRRLTLFRCCAALNEKRPNTEGTWPLGAAVLQEITVHGHLYPHRHEQSVFGFPLGKDDHEEESLRTRPMALLLLCCKLTLAEDRQLRDLVKTIADTNGDWQNTKVSLGNNMVYDFDPAKDVPLAAARMRKFNNGTPRTH